MSDDLRLSIPGMRLKILQNKNPIIMLLRNNNGISSVTVPWIASFGRSENMLKILTIHIISTYIIPFQVLCIFRVNLY